ncbi:hypothetical protein ASZ90_017441 [hydrocarbon metagenome]|uniref:Cell wall-active antibiotics response LiaF-like C-terminal domain-containing protein n=1 Tax=hydrocarbon metagenome TaxID=938273 RepID=A0A0W8E940_9ZZZZ
MAHNLKTSNILGILIIGLGIILLLNAFGITQISIAYLWGLFWPSILILAGINYMIGYQRITGILIGLILTGLGAAYLGRNLGLYSVDFSLLWKTVLAALLIIWGISMLLGEKGISKTNLAIMGGVEKKGSPWELKSSDYLALMGGVELDLRDAIISDKEVDLNLLAIMGGINIVLPADTSVKWSGTSFLGGVNVMGKGSGGIFGSSQGSIQTEANERFKLNLRMNTIMGGIEVKK